MNNSLALVRRLVEDFRLQEAAYLSSDYQESQVRQDFIDKFFTALGWDVTHERQKNPYEQEVKIENRVKMSGSQRYADYAFFIAPNFRDVKFFVEAKKPSRNLANLDDYYQTIRYGWNSNTPIAVLTDFEEFHVLDCRYTPNRDAALDRVTEVFRYADYANEETFARVFYLFGREAVANGSLDKRAAELPKPRGKAAQRGLVKGAYQQVDEAFLVALDGYRDTLAHAFKATNPHLSGEELTEAVQRTIDRLVFIRFLEDKQIEDPTIVEFSSKPSAWRAFVAYCKLLESKYNGLIFKPHRILDSDDPSTVSGQSSSTGSAHRFVPPDDEKFARICSELSDRTSPYDFDKIPISILGSIYERFLGKVVSATEKRVKVIEKPEVRKAGGVYYTPEYIVRYIVKETVGKVIEGKSPDQIATMAFADIACGSGSFLLEVYDTLLEYHRRWYNEHPDKAKKGDVDKRDSELMLTLKKRQEILSNNIYGVDIDFQATEVTQLSLYLKLLEDVTLTQMHLFKEKVLPNLSRNIICGNSLIEPDIELQTSFDLHTPSALGGHPSQEGTPITHGKSKQEPNTFPSGEGNRRGVSDVDALKPIRFIDAFPNVMAARQKDGGRGGGFDAIVGNPPYVDIKGLDEMLVAYLFDHFKSANNRVNLFAAFIERGLSILKQHTGNLSMIVPTALLTQESYQTLRRMIVDNFALHSIVRIPNESFGVVAGDVKVDTAVFVVGSTRDDNEVEVIAYEGYTRIKTIDPDTASTHFFVNQSTWASRDESIWSINTSSVELILLARCEAIGLPLEKLCEFSLGLTPYDKYRGHSKRQIENRVFHARQKMDDTFKPLLAGNDVTRYYVQWNGQEWISYGPWLGAAREARFFTQKRILVKQIIDWTRKRIWAAITSQEFYNTQNAFNLLQNSDLALEYVLAILNSRLMSFYHRKRFLDEFKMRFQKILIKDCRRFPIRTINFSDPEDKKRHDHIVKLVEQMLAAKEKLAKTKTDAEVNRLEMQCESLDRQIDAAVYELYGLTEEEIGIVEK